MTDEPTPEEIHKAKRPTGHTTRDHEGGEVFDFLRQYAVDHDVVDDPLQDLWTHVGHGTQQGGMIRARIIEDLWRRAHGEPVPWLEPDE